MKTWKNAELVELNINETAWGLWPSDKERGIIIGTNGLLANNNTNTNNNNGGSEEDTTKGPSVTPDTLS